MKEKGIESYVPLQTVIWQWSDRRKKIKVPIFSCYVFVWILLQEKLSALQVDDILRFVSFSGSLSPIPDKEINAVKQVLENTNDFQLTQYIDVERTVEIVQEPLKEIQGCLIEHRGKKRFLVEIEEIGQGISMEIQEYDVHPIISKE